MKTSKAIVICESYHHQNTMKVATAIAGAIDASILTTAQVSPEMLGEVNLIGLGSGIYFGRFHSQLCHWIKQLPDVTVPKYRAFLFSTSGLPLLWRLWHRSFKKMLVRKGFEVVGEFHCSGFDTVGPLALVGGLNRGHPNQRDLIDATVFAHNLALSLIN